MVFDYASALQNMQLNAGVWISADDPLDLFHPDTQAIRDTAGQDFHYQISKINEYLSSSDAYSAGSAVTKLTAKGKAWMSESNWETGANATNAEWAIAMLLEMIPILNQYYVIDPLGSSDREIYFQYLVAMYLVSQEKN
ncbi:hypothetical protein [Oenococcus sp.]|uniref:hypothetical protein n=1 Tax=Oenococcus sp. TaxID=1979414 RepID=UPI0039E9501A